METYLKGMKHTLSRLTAQIIEPLDFSADFRSMKPTHSARCDSQGFSGILVNWSAFL